MDQKDFRILLVDDFEMVRMMVRNALNDLGYTNVEEAEDGRVAMVKIREAQGNGKAYGLVFCDWNMPEMTGIEVLETCRADATLKGLPIVMVTAEADQESVVRALRAGATDYVVKPVSPEILEKKVNKILSMVKAA